MAASSSSYQPSAGAAVQRNADVLPFPFPARPQAMTIYVRFIEMGTILEASVRIVEVSDIAAAGPLFRVFPVSGLYAFEHVNAAGANSRATLAVAPSIGNGVELLAQLTAGGTCKLIQSINEAAETETAESSALLLSPAWSSTILFVNDRLAEDRGGFIALRNLVFHRGVQSLETMRRLAGV
jgi:hypothetical protein